MKKPEKLLLVVIASLMAAGIFITWNSYDQRIPKGYVEETSYRHRGICEAIIPECGYCVGLVIDDKCYVKTNE